MQQGHTNFFSLNSTKVYIIFFTIFTYSAQNILNKVWQQENFLSPEISNFENFAGDI